MKGNGAGRCLTAILMGLCMMHGFAGAQPNCRKVSFEGRVQAGGSFRQAIGAGWVFALRPITPGLDRGGYSGWDLVVDRERPQGYPDALLIMTPPYRSMNEREIGTSYGLRSQDALGWSQRSFHFLTDPALYTQAQGLYRKIESGSKAEAASAAGALATMLAGTASGELRILDARIVPGQGDAVPYAESWAVASARVEHVNEPPAAGKGSVRGEMRQMHFRVTLWLPVKWPAVAGASNEMASCPQ